MQQVTSYAGVSSDGETMGTQTFDANDWEPYIRTMPHAEYPSGSACVCEAFAQSLIEYFGTDNITEIVGEPLTASFSAFSSRYEPLSTPSTDIEFEFDSWTEMSNRCAISRINGGMHFTESIVAGRQLCGDIGQRVTQSVLALANGELPQYVIDFDNLASVAVERDCYPTESDSSESSSSGKSGKSGKSSSSDKSGKSGKSGSSSSDE